MTTGWVHFGLVCGGTHGGTVVHAVDGFQVIPKSRRKTLDARCGKRVNILGAHTTNGERISLPWPPYVSGAASVGLTRCGDCYALTGRKKPEDHMGSTEWHKGRNTETWRRTHPVSSKSDYVPGRNRDEA